MQTPETGILRAEAVPSRRECVRERLCERERECAMTEREPVRVCVCVCVCLP